MLKLITVLATLFAIAAGHGMMWDPPGRSTVWRFDRTAPTNYADNQVWCGSSGVHHGVNKGKCGVCGDDYRLPHPQPNENTGIYGRGKIMKTYRAGQVIEVTSKITANHLGNIQYHLCKIENSKAPESGEACFKPLRFSDGAEKLKITYSHSTVKSLLRLPAGFTCKHCVLRWTYTAGNNWGMCGDGTGALGCGPQETFRSCADIAIV